MKANEFVEKYGIDKCREVIASSANALVECGDGSTIHVNDLKRLVESHNLVENATPEELYKASVQEGVWSNYRLKQAIDDMEELNEEEH